MTNKQRLYLKGLASGKTKKDAALDAGYSLETAENAKSHIEDAVGKSRISAILDKLGGTDEAIAQVFIDAMTAKKSEHVGKGVMKRVKDHAIRTKTAETMAKLKGHFVEKVEHSGAVDQIVIFKLPEKEDES